MTGSKGSVGSGKRVGARREEEGGEVEVTAPGAIVASSRQKAVRLLGNTKFKEKQQEKEALVAFRASFRDIIML